MTCWIVFGQLLSFIFEKVPQDQGGASRLLKFIKTVSPEGRHNALLIGAFIISAYFSIAAMIAVPWMEQEKGPKELEESRIKQLADVKGIQEGLKEHFPDLGKANPFEAIEEQTIILPKLKDETLLEQWRSLISRLKIDREFCKQSRDSAISQVNPFLGQAWARILKSEASAIRKFKEEMGSMGTQEQEKYFRDIMEWHRLNIGDIESKVQQVQSNLIRYEEALKAYAVGYKNYWSCRRGIC
jgi:hypothetical protein